MTHSTYDTAQSLNAFLECIGGAPVQDTPSYPSLFPKTSSAVTREKPQEADQKTRKVVLLDEAGKPAQNSSLRVVDSKHSSKYENSASPNTPATRPYRTFGAHPATMRLNDTPERRALINKLKETAEVKNFQDIMLARFKENVKISQNTGTEWSNIRSERPPVQQNTEDQVSPNGSPPSETEQLPEFEDISKIIGSAAVMRPKDIEARIDSESAKDGEPENASPEKLDVEEAREHMTHFSTWGEPASRGKPRSRVRKVIIAGLPATTDFTLVQSLISGGAVDTMMLSANGRTAYVTFASGEACDNFYDKYPNGITFKHGGQSHTVFVDRSSEVDVISGVLQGHLDCGATRCVRVAGIDEEWGMRALYRVAEGQKGRRKVENILDSFRNGIRVVLLRFTSIADAVDCRARFLRSLDFEDCTVEFTKDPCELADGIHME